MAGSLAVMAGSAASKPRDNAGLVARLLRHLARPLLPHGRWLRLDEANPETVVVSCHGAVEIRQTPAGFSVQTCVKGEPARARATALQRLANYLTRTDRGGTRLRVAGPLLQREEAPGRWLISVGLPGVEDALVAAVSRNGKVRIRPVQPELHAVLFMYGRPTPKALARADAAIRATLARTMWVPSGGPTIRLRRPLAILPFAGSFEIALPVVGQQYHVAAQHERRGGIAGPSTATERATPPSLTVH